MTTMNPQQCEVCPVNKDAKLVRLGLEAGNFDFVVALAGNPNVGKSTVFNSLTGLRQHTGNWPGKTVVRAEGAFSYDAKRYKLVDLPGTYSLLSTSTDEEVARDFILFGQPDVTVVVVDATRLERNLNLVLQVLEITDKAVVCLNLVDEAKRHGIVVEERVLMRDLGVPVIPTAARNNQGIPELLRAIAEVATGTFVCKPKRFPIESGALHKAIGKMTAKVQQAFPSLPNARWVALRLLEGDQRIVEAIRSGELGDLTRRSALEDSLATSGKKKVHNEHSRAV